MFSTNFPSFYPHHWHLNDIIGTDDCSNYDCIILQIPMPVDFLAWHALLYKNIVDLKLRSLFGQNSKDENAKSWHEQGVWMIFGHILNPGNKWYFDWSCFETMNSIPTFDIFSHSQWKNPSPSDLNPIFPGQNQANPSIHFTPSRPSV